MRMQAILTISAGYSNDLYYVNCDIIRLHNNWRGESLELQWCLREQIQAWECKSGPICLSGRDGLVDSFTRQSVWMEPIAGDWRAQLTSSALGCYMKGSGCVIGDGKCSAVTVRWNQKGGVGKRRVCHCIPARLCACATFWVTSEA